MPTSRTTAGITGFATFVFRHRVGIISTILLLAFDQAAKLTVVRAIPVGESWPATGLLQLTQARNSGSALDLFSGHTVALIAGSAICITMLIALYLPRPKTGARPQVAFGLMLAGALGNLIDRILFGHVVDFIDVLPWFIFNVADIAILFGLIGFAWDIPDVTARLLTESREQS